MVRLLLVEDDVCIVQNLTDFLNGEGFVTDTVSGQADAVAKLDGSHYDLLLVDLSLSDGNGYAVCSAAKAMGDIPVVFLTAADDEYNVVTGLDMGADDYIRKPFRPRELVSRLRSVLRRAGKIQSELTLGDLTVNTVKATVQKNGRELYLSALEYRLLLVFLQNKGNVLPRNKLLEEIWDAAGEFVNDNTLSVYIKRLREKIEDDPQHPQFIKTVRGLGYKVGE